MNNTPAFPVTGSMIGMGMTLRDYFAGKAMQSLVADPDDQHNMTRAQIATWAYAMADAMLKAREGEMTPEDIIRMAREATMSDKPEALRLADALEQGKYLLSVERDATAAELRRLFAIEAQRDELLEALRDALHLIETISPIEGDTSRRARAAIAKAGGNDD